MSSKLFAFFLKKNYFIRRKKLIQQTRCHTIWKSINNNWSSVNWSYIKAMLKDEHIFRHLIILSLTPFSTFNILIFSSKLKSEMHTTFSSFLIFLVSSTFFLLTFLMATRFPLYVPTLVYSCLLSISECEVRDTLLDALVILLK